MEQEEKLRAYEKMQEAIRVEYVKTQEKMEQLKNEGKVKSATYKQLMGKKLTYKNMLDMYELYGLNGGVSNS